MKKKYTLRVPIEVTVTGYVGMHDDALLNALEGTIDEALTGVGDLLLDELSEYDEKDRGEVEFMSGGIFLEDR